MQIWFLYAISAPILWAVTNHIDKFVISRYTKNKNPASLVLFSSIIAGVAALAILIFAPIEHLSFFQSVSILVAGALVIAGYIPYMYALSGDEVSIAAPLYQMIAPLSYIFGAIFLHESLSGKQVFAGGLIIAGAVLMTLDFDNFHWKGKIFKLMLLASVLLTLNTVIFKIIGLESSFWTASLWEYLGSFIFGILLLFLPSYRNDFKSLVVEGGSKIFSLNIFSEVLNIIARLLSKFATLLVPIALISVVNGTQPFFIFLYGWLLYLFFPKIESENFSRKHFSIKLLAILIMIFGSVLLFL